MSIGEKIKEIRLQNGLMQKEVAIKIGINQSNYSKMESGNRNPSAATLKKLADLFHVPMDSFYTTKVITNPSKFRIADASTIRIMRLFSQLAPEDKHTVFRIISSMIAKKQLSEIQKIEKKTKPTGEKKRK